MSLCQYKNIFGAPNEGVHSHRFAGFAIVDIVATILLAMIISKYAKSNFLKTLLIIFIIAQIFHYLFCVETAFLKLIKLY